MQGALVWFKQRVLPPLSATPGPKWFTLFRGRPLLDQGFVAPTPCQALSEARQDPMKATHVLGAKVPA